MNFSGEAVPIQLRGSGTANVLDADAMARLEVALWAAERRGARAAVIHGSSGRFAAGADLGALEQLDGPAAHAFAVAGARLFRRLESMPLWLVAAVDGHCIGGGFDVALACDAIVATPRAVFRHPGTLMGFPTAYGGNRRLPARVGRTRAGELLLRGRALTASESWDAGLVAEIVPAEELLDRALRRATTWTAGVPPAMAPALQAFFRRSGELAPSVGMALERASARLYHRTLDATSPAAVPGPC